MGMLGAMAGAGQGLQNYAGVMRENQKLAWQAEQNSTEHEREVSLENLRASNTAKENQVGRDFQAGQLSEARTYQEGRDATLRTQDQEDTKTSQDYAIKAQGIQFNQNLEKQKALLKEEGAIKMTQAKDMYKFTKDMDAKERKSQVDKIEASPDFKSLPKEKQKQVRFAIEHPKAAEILAISNKSEKFPREQYRLAYQDGQEQWDSIDKNEKKAVLIRAAEAGIKDPQDIRDYYASDIARKATGLDKLVRGSGVDTPKPKGAVPVEKAVELAKAGKVTAEQIDEKVKLGSYTPQEGQTIKDALVQKEKETGALQGPAPASKSNYEYGKVGRSIPDAMHKLGDTSNIAPVPEDRKQYLQQQRNSR